MLDSAFLWSARAALLGTRRRALSLPWSVGVSFLRAVSGVFFLQKFRNQWLGLLTIKGDIAETEETFLQLDRVLCPHQALRNFLQSPEHSLNRHSLCDQIHQGIFPYM